MLPETTKLPHLEDSDRKETSHHQLLRIAKASNAEVLGMADNDSLHDRAAPFPSRGGYFSNTENSSNLEDTSKSRCFSTAPNLVAAENVFEPKQSPNAEGFPASAITLKQEDVSQRDPRDLHSLEMPVSIPDHQIASEDDDLGFQNVISFGSKANKPTRTHSNVYEWPMINSLHLQGNRPNGWWPRDPSKWPNINARTEAATKNAIDQGSADAGMCRSSDTSFQTLNLEDFQAADHTTQNSDADRQSQDCTCTTLRYLKTTNDPMMGGPDLLSLLPAMDQDHSPVEGHLAGDTSNAVLFSQLLEAETSYPVHKSTTVATVNMAPSAVLSPDTGTEDSLPINFDEFIHNDDDTDDHDQDQDMVRRDCGNHFSSHSNDSIVSHPDGKGPSS